jgi:hypothetical protein
MVNLISIAGYSGSGKDTFCRFIQEELVVRRVEAGEISPQFSKFQSSLDNLSTFTNRKFAEFPKKICSDILNVPVEKWEDQDFKASRLPELWQRPGIVTHRDFLITTAQSLKEVNPDIYVNMLLHLYSGANMIITDLRFPNEWDRLKELGALTVNVIKDVEDGKYLVDTLLGTKRFNVIVKNNGTLDDLRDKARKFVNLYL